MNNSEAYIDRVLQDTIDMEKYRQSQIRSTVLRYLFEFNKGDSVSLTLQSTEEPYDLARVEGLLANPKQALIDVKYTEHLDEWQGRTIGLATHSIPSFRGRTEGPHPFTVAGDQEAMYFTPEDIFASRQYGDSVRLENIRPLHRKYGRVVIDGLVLIDFINK
jgi:hypothetical protein